MTIFTFTTYKLTFAKKFVASKNNKIQVVRHTDNSIDIFEVDKHNVAQKLLFSADKDTRVVITEEDNAVFVEVYTPITTFFTENSNCSNCTEEMLKRDNFSDDEIREVYTELIKSIIKEKKSRGD